MRKATGLSVLVMAIMVWLFLSEEKSTDQPASNAGSAPSTKVQERAEDNHKESAWRKLQDRLNERLVHDASRATEMEPEPKREERVFDTFADVLAAAGVTPEEEAEFEDWALEHGIEVQSLGYEFYGRATLEALADSGDIFALQRLADDAAWNNQQYLRADVLYRKAAVRGSLVALDRLALNATSMAMKAGASDQPERAKDHLMDALAWTQLSERRSGQFLMAGQRESNIQRHLERLDINLDEADQAIIDERASTLYQELHRSRERLNLGELNNSIPTMIQKIHQQGLDEAAVREP